MRLLVLLLCWGGVCLGCETGVAYPGQSLSPYRSSLANADLALIGTHTAPDVNSCLHDCCTEKYGACTVASFRRNATADNCRLFNCRPLQKCMFAPSHTTDSFAFSSVPSPTLASNSSSPHSSANTTTTSTTTEEPVALKNDNTSSKPRKGVVEEERSGVKPRKGVGEEEDSTSGVKPRKGVGLQPSTTLAQDVVEHQTPSVYHNLAADDLASALGKVFEDDVTVTSSRDSVVTSSKVSVVDRLPEVTSIRPSSTIDAFQRVAPTSLTSSHFAVTSSPTRQTTSTTSGASLLPSIQTSHVAASSTPRLQQTWTTAAPPSGVSRQITPLSPSGPNILEHSRLIFHESGNPDTESERKYESSMHLVLSLVFGLLILVSVLGVVAKRVYDGWMRRHYRRMDFLIDGMYNGYEG